MVSKLVQNFIFCLNIYIYSKNIFRKDHFYIHVDRDKIRALDERCVRHL